MNFNCCVAFFHITATKIMVKEYKVFVGLNFIMLILKPPLFRPLKYSLFTKCHYVCSAEEIYRDSSDVINSMRNAITIHRLHPGLKCEIKVVAVYHPASSDPGLTFNLNTYSSR